MADQNNADAVALVDGLIVAHGNLCHLEELAAPMDRTVRDTYRAAVLAAMGPS